MLHRVNDRSVKDLKRRLEAARHAAEATDDAGTRAEREREVGRLYMELRRAQRPPAVTPEPVSAPPQPSWMRNPFVIGTAGVVLLAAGIAGGVVIARWGAPAATPQAAVETAAPPSGMTPVELQALRQVASRADAPLPSLLQLAHAELDAGRTGEARRLYDRVLAREPGNAEAVTHLGAALYAEGQVDAALAKVEEALKLDPRYIHAHWDRVQYLFHGKQDYPATVKAAEAFLQVVPDGPDAEQVRKVMTEARSKR
jgi:tetratricopeptide (TPR) repeat protein